MVSAEPKKIFNSSSAPPEVCIFCLVASGKTPSHVLYDDGLNIAFLATSPFSRGHTLVCPKRHGETIWEMKQEETAGLFGTAVEVSKAVVTATRADGFRLLQNNGDAANQGVPHVHVHVIPVMTEDKEKFNFNRMKFTQEEMKSVADAIRAALPRQPVPDLPRKTNHAHRRSPP